MPRYADHEERRDELADTVCEIILDHGLDRVSVRSVAERAGSSVGAIRYYFPRQEDLLVHALQRTIDRAFSAVRASEQMPAESVEECACNVLMAVAPIDEPRRNVIRIWIAFMDRGLSHPGIALLMERVWRDARFYSRRNIARFAEIPVPEAPHEILDDPFLEESTTILHVMWDGMALQGVMSPKTMTPQEIEAVGGRVVGTIYRRVRDHLADPQTAE